MSAKPRASYGPILVGYLAVAGGLTYAARRLGRELPRPHTSDVVLLGLGTFKLSRLVAKEKVLQPVREPFVDHTSTGASGEVNSEPGGSGVRRAVGELLTCPFCVSVWIATVLIGVFSIAPRAARLAAAGLASVVVADVSQYAYCSLRDKAS